MKTPQKYHANDNSYANSYIGGSPSFSAVVAGADSDNLSAKRKIFDVWDYNFEEEFDKLVQLLPEYNHVAMDTEFPGTVAKAISTVGSSNTADYSKFSYINAAYNVNCTKVIQIGLSLFNSAGKNAVNGSTWQFNMHFDNEEMNAPDSMNLLINAGIDFKKIKKNGINQSVFSEKFLTSGLVLNNSVTWIVYHGISDFGYLLKMATGTNIPYEHNEFLEMMRVYFPYVYDVKHLVSTIEQFRGRLQDLANSYRIRRYGICHQAGSDAMVTGDCFFKIKHRSLRNTVLQSHCGILAHLSTKGYADVIKNGFASFDPPVPTHLVKPDVNAKSEK